MSVKIVIVFVCAAVGTLTGYLVMREMKRERDYFQGLCGMIVELKRNITYRQDSAASVLSAFPAESPLLKKNITQYIEYVSQKDGALETEKGFLSADAYAQVCALFASIGRSDSATQIKELEGFAASFESFRLAAEQKYKKLGALSVKLGFLFGAGVGILFL